MKKVYLILLIFIPLASPAQWGKKAYTDSIKSLLETAKQDTNRVNLLLSLFSHTDHADTVERFRLINEASALAAALKWDKGMMLASDNLGDYYNQLAYYPKAIAYYRESLLRASEMGDIVSEAMRWAAIGIVYQNKSEYAKAIECFRQALALKAGRYYELSVHGNMGIAYNCLGDYPKALACFEDTYKMLDEEIRAAKHSNLDDTSMLVLLLKEIAEVNLSMADYGRAIEHFGQIEQLNRYLNIKLFDEWINMGKGKIYLIKKEYANAVPYYEKALEDAGKDKKSEDEPIILDELGNIYLALADPQKALNYSMQSLAILKKDSTKTDLEQLPKTYITIGKIYTKKRDFPKARGYLEDAIAICKKTGALDNEKEALLALSNTYEAMGEQVEAFGVYKNYIALRDSIFSQDKAREVTRIEMQGDFDREKVTDSLVQAKKDVAIRLSIQRQRALIYGGFAGLAAVLLLSFFIFRGYSREKKANAIISKANETINKEKHVSETLLHEIQVKNKAITDNINYAQRIQSAILPDIKLITKALAQSFILFIPKDIVSGDFYAFSEKKGRVLIIAGDCTGHGVSGAFMSMIGSSLLNQIINERGIVEPAMVLNQLNSSVIEALKQNENESAAADGMDISICSFDLAKNELQYAGANRPLWLIRNQSVEIYKPDKFPIGGLQMAHNRSFTNCEVQLQKNDTLYIFTDGYADQFGGDKGKKMMTAKFKEMLLSIQHLNMREQETYLKTYFDKWKGNNEQVDDVLVIGVRV